MLLQSSSASFVTLMFTFEAGEHAIWMAPVTRSMLCRFEFAEVKADGNQYAVITLLPSGDRITVLADQLFPAF